MQSVQASTSLLYFSRWVISPSWYCCSYSLTFCLHLGDQLVLGLRDDQIVLAERDAGLARLREAERHQPVAEDHGLLLAAVAVDLVDQVADLLLAQQPVDQVEADAAGCAAGFRVSSMRPGVVSTRRVIGLPSSSTRLVARLDRGVQRHAPWRERLLDLADIVERHALARLAVALHA